MRCGSPARSSRAQSSEQCAAADPSENPKPTEAPDEEDSDWEVAVWSETDLDKQPAQKKNGPPQEDVKPKPSKAPPQPDDKARPTKADPAKPPEKRTPMPRKQKAMISEIAEALKTETVSAALLKWILLLEKAASNRRWSARAHAAKMGKRVRGSWQVDTGKSRGFGGRSWGWRQILVF